MAVEKVPFLYERHGSTCVPSGMVRGSRAEGTQNGAMVAGLLAAVLDAMPAPVPMIATDLHFTLLKPEPFEASCIDLRVVRLGRKLEVLEGK